MSSQHEAGRSTGFSRLGFSDWPSTTSSTTTPATHSSYGRLSSGPHPNVSSDSSVFASGTTGMHRPHTMDAEQLGRAAATRPRLRFPSSYIQTAFGAQFEEAHSQPEKRSVSDPLDGSTSRLAADSLGRSPVRSRSSSSAGEESSDVGKDTQSHVSAGGRKASHRAMLVASLLQADKKARQGQGSGRLTPRRVTGQMRRSTQIDWRSSASPVVILNCPQGGGGRGRRWSVGGGEGYQQGAQRLDFLTGGDLDKPEGTQEEEETSRQRTRKSSMHVPEKYTSWYSPDAGAHERSFSCSRQDLHRNVSTFRYLAGQQTYV